MKRILSGVLLMLLLLTLAACGNSAAAYQEQYDLGVKYLSEGNYEEAILAFTAAIEIDPKRAESYAGLADSYLGQGNYEKAAEILKQGAETTGDKKLAAWLAEMESGIINDSLGRMYRENYYDGNGTLLYYEENVWQEWKRSALHHYDAKGKIVWSHKFTYSLEGDLVGWTSYDASGAVTTSVQPPEESGFNVKIQGTSWNLDGTISSAHVDYYEKDNRDHVVKAVRYSGKAIESYAVYEYDSRGNVSKRVEYDENGTSTGYWLNEYDSAGNQTRTSAFRADGTLSMYFVSTYDARGNSIKQVSYLSDGSISSGDETEYDAAGNRTKLTWYGENWTVREIDTYDYENNRCTKHTVYDGGGTLKEYWLNEYDADGNNNETLHYSADGTLLDSHGQ